MQKSCTIWSHIIQVFNAARKRGHWLEFVDLIISPELPNTKIEKVIETTVSHISQFHLKFFVGVETEKKVIDPTVSLASQFHMEFFVVYQFSFLSWIKHLYLSQVKSLKKLIMSGTYPIVEEKILAVMIPEYSSVS